MENMDLVTLFHLALPKRKTNWCQNLNACSFNTTERNHLKFGMYSCFIIIYRWIKTCMFAFTHTNNKNILNLLKKNIKLFSVHNFVEKWHNLTKNVMQPQNINMLVPLKGKEYVRMFTWLRFYYLYVSLANFWDQNASYSWKWSFGADFRNVGTIVLLNLATLDHVVLLWSVFSSHKKLFYLFIIYL